MEEDPEEAARRPIVLVLQSLVNFGLVPLAIIWIISAFTDISATSPHAFLGIDARRPPLAPLARGTPRAAVRAPRPASC